MMGGTHEDVAAMFDLLAGGYVGSRVLEVKKRRFAAHDHSPSGAGLRFPDPT